MATVLGVVGSPRANGNTHVLVDSTKGEVRKRGDLLSAAHELGRALAGRA
jgi:multimeric flavodoxin WrbA